MPKGGDTKYAYQVKVVLGELKFNSMGLIAAKSVKGPEVAAAQLLVGESSAYVEYRYSNMDATRQEWNRMNEAVKMMTTNNASSSDITTESIIEAIKAAQALAKPKLRYVTSALAPHSQPLKRVQNGYEMYLFHPDDLTKFLLPMTALNGGMAAMKPATAEEWLEFSGVVSKAI